MAPRRGAVLAGLAAVAATPSALRAQTPTSIRIGAAPTAATAQHLYANDNGTFAALGLSAQITALRNAGELIAALIGGSLDVITTTLVPIAQAHAKGIDLRVIAPGNIYAGPPPQAVVAVALDSPIKSGADLNGKTMAVAGLGDLTQVSLQAWVDQTGGDSKTVKLIEIPFPSVAAALAQGRVDAGMLVEPFTTAAKGQVRIIGDPQAAIGRNYVVTGWHARADWLDANRDVARRYVEAMQQTAKWANNNRDQASVILAKYTGMSAEAIGTTARAVYGEQPISAAMVQPVLDYSTRYIGLAKTPAAALLWRA